MDAKTGIRTALDELRKAVLSTCAQFQLEVEDLRKFDKAMRHNIARYEKTDRSDKAFDLAHVRTEKLHSLFLKKYPKLEIDAPNLSATARSVTLMFSAERNVRSNPGQTVLDICHAFQELSYAQGRFIRIPELHIRVVKRASQGRDAVQRERVLEAYRERINTFGSKKEANEILAVEFHRSESAVEKWLIGEEIPPNNRRRRRPK